MEQAIKDVFSMLIAFVSLSWPGLLSVHIYRLIVPGRAMQWGTSAYQGLFFTVLNYIVLFPAARFAWSTENVEEAPLLYWTSLVSLFLVGPIGLPLSWIVIRRLPVVVRFLQHPDPTLWDHYFSRRENKFMILHLVDGSMLGGYFGPGSCASAYPDQGDLYLSALYQIDENGNFGAPMEDTDGLLIRKDQYTCIELFRLPGT